MASNSNIPSTNEIRRRFLAYFAAKGHAEIASSPVVPHDDPTLLFTNAGMNQFKDVFLGQSKREYSRAVSSQKCVRVGGKHNDLDNVGHTTRHLTFFEMLGNFSFGDYFKEQAIQFAWEVSTEIFQFAPEKIFPTVFTTDDEAFEIWTRYVPAERITRFGEKDNFWSMGDTGPCGPCSELYYDRGPRYGEAKSPAFDSSGERYLEFWNLVFMQYNQSPNGRSILPKPSIDTGSGLERVMSLIMNVDTVFETDVLRELIATVERLSGKRYDPNDSFAPAFRVIADHVRSLAFAIADGAQPSNTDRGYVLRKILRRAVRYGKMLGFEKPFLADILPSLRSIMGDQYRELSETAVRASEVITTEEENFLRTLKRGGSLLQDVLDRAQKNSQHAISGDDAFKLKDTYGMPVDEIQLIAHDTGLEVDMLRYKELEEEARKRSKAAHKTAQVSAETSLYEEIMEREGTTHFVRDILPSLESHVLSLVQNGIEVDEIQEGQSGEVILDKTLFYAEMGGQVGDTGTLFSPHMKARVLQTTSPFKGVVSHRITVEKGQLTKGSCVSGQLDIDRRSSIEKNHTVTHLLHVALCEVLGPHVRQSGSLVDPEYLRFDFSHHKSMTLEELQAIENYVNEHIQANYAVQSYELPYEEVQKRSDIKQFFGDKYGAIVRVVEVGPSKELCGGTHTSNTGKIGLFRIVKESSIASGVRRIEAVSGKQALSFSYEKEGTLQEIAHMLKVPVNKIIERLSSLLIEQEALEKTVKELKNEKIQMACNALTQEESRKYAGTQLVYGSLPCSSQDLKDAAAEILKRNGGHAFIVLGCQEAGKAHLFIRVPDTLSSQVSASDILKKAVVIIDGNGGGKKEAAQGAGKSPEKLHSAISMAVASIET